MTVTARAMRSDLSALRAKIRQLQSQLDTWQLLVHRHQVELAMVRDAVETTLGTLNSIPLHDVSGGTGLTTGEHDIFDEICRKVAAREISSADYGQLIHDLQGARAQRKYNPPKESNT